MRLELFCSSVSPSAWRLRGKTSQRWPAPPDACTCCRVFGTPLLPALLPVCNQGSPEAGDNDQISKFEPRHRRPYCARAARPCRVCLLALAHGGFRNLGSLLGVLILRESYYLGVYIRGRNPYTCWYDRKAHGSRQAWHFVSSLARVASPGSQARIAQKGLGFRHPNAIRASLSSVGDQDINEMDTKLQALLEKILAQRGAPDGFQLWELPLTCGPYPTD